MTMRIRELRRRANLDQTELGSRMGVSQSTISEWENEIYLPKARDLPLLANVLGVTIDELFEPIEGAS